jgi:hypothetical protein
MANKVFDHQIKAIKGEIKKMAPDFQKMIVTPEQVEAGKSLSSDFILKKKKFLISISGYHNHSCFSARVEVEFPEPIPVPMDIFSKQQKEFRLGEQHEALEFPSWAVQDQQAFFFDTLVPAGQRLEQKAIEKIDFRDSLSSRMDQVTTLKNLKAASPELHDEWVKYFGEAVGTLPALQFEDVLAVMHQNKEKVA